MNGLITQTEALWLGLAAHLWQTTIVLALLALVARLLRNAPARMLSTLWWIGVLKLFLPLHLLGGLSSKLIGALASGGVTPSGAETVSIWLYPIALRFPGDLEVRLSHPVFLWLTVAWLLGTSTILIAWLLRRMRGRIRLATKPAATLVDKLARSSAAVGIPHGAVALVAGRRLPLVAGLLRPRIVVPERLVEALSADELGAILLHENEHRLRRDTLRGVILGVAVAVFFFYPPVWWLLGRVRRSTEMACDEAVLRAGVAADAYRRSLARTLALGLLPSVTATAIHGARPSSIRDRLERLASPERYAMLRQHRLALAAGLLIVLAGSFLPLVPGSALPAQASSKAAAAWELDRLIDADVPVMINFRETEVTKILESISRTTGIRMEIVEPFRDRIVTVETTRVPVKEALTKLAEVAHLRYEVRDGATLVVRSNWLAGIDEATSPELIPVSQVQPHYPEELRAAGIEGNVILEALIDEHGDVVEVKLLRSTPPDQRALIDSALEAVEQWRFLPATVDGTPVSVYFTVFIEFKLN